MEIIREEIIDKKKIHVIDGAVAEPDVKEFFNFVSGLSFRRNERDHDGDLYPIFSVDFKPDFMEETAIGNIAAKLLQRIYPESCFQLFRSYINMSHYGDLEYPHRDCAVKGTDVTVLYYVNLKWDYQWGGETMFYEGGDTRLAVLPKSGRFLIFPGSIEHIGSVPSRACNESRFSLAMKYKMISSS